MLSVLGLESSCHKQRVLTLKRRQRKIKYNVLAEQQLKKQKTLKDPHNPTAASNFSKFGVPNPVNGSQPGNAGNPCEDNKRSTRIPLRGNEYGMK